MAHAVFVRAANVGGNNVFRPALVAKALSHLDVVNIGAAGTFVVRARTNTQAIHAELRRHLPFEPTLAIRPGREITSLVARDPFKGVPIPKDARAWVGVLTGRPCRQPVLPYATPKGALWSVRILELDGPFALGQWRRRPGGFVIPGNCVEDAVGVPATVRWWETIVKVANVLES